MLIKSPADLHYPITVANLRKQVHDTVKRQEALFEYSYRTRVTEEDEFGRVEHVHKVFYGTFESTVDGTIRSWVVDKGTSISGPSSALAEIEEECAHSVQYGGMCVECGRDLTTMDYNAAAPETVRASTTVTPNHQALRISDEEAARSDAEAKERLIGQRKLSLVVDLDLTIIHASVDPTIKEWMDDEQNPNHPAVRDVRVFELFDDALQRNVSYYIKLRPHLHEFLRKMSKLYELHIYTMGTRAYAENIANLVDPERKLFGARILSRTETPGEISKNLRKLFPVDNRMVVIIDDRADVWNWSNYLVRVQPFNFFVGIGDINSSFLPKQDETAKPSIGPPSDPVARDAETEKNEQPSAAPDEGDIGPIKLQRSPTSSSSDIDAQTDRIDGDESALGQMVSMQERADAGDIQRKTQEQDETLAAQLNERPLLQLQKSLEKEQEEAAASVEEGEEGEEVGLPDEAGENREPSVTVERARSASRPPVPQNLLKDDDRELHRIEAMLEKIQNTFYNIFDERMEENDYKATGPSLIPDVKEVIERHRFLPLRGCRVVFSRLVPRHVDIMRTRWADMAMRLGAVVQGDVSYRSELREDTTHLICKPGDPTDKMKEAASLNIKKRKRQEEDIHIVGPEWLLEGVSQWWQRIDETPYLVYVEPPRKRRRSSGTADDQGFSDAIEASADHSEDGGHDPKGVEDDTLDDGNEAEVDYEDEDGDKSPSEDEAEWAEAFASDENDEEFSESEDDGGSKTPTTAKVNGSRVPAKRRHEDDSDKGSESDGSSVGSSQGSSAKEKPSLRGSDLQRRKKRALARTSSLTKVTNVSTPDVNTSEPDEGQDAMEAAMMEALDEAFEGEEDE